MPTPRGFSLVEASIASAVLGVLVLGALQSLGAAGYARRDLSDRAMAVGLADALLAEIAAKPYEDPQLGAGALGGDAGDAGSGRLAFDDADDYADYGDSPLHPDGSAMVAGENWKWEVTVEWVSISAAGAVAPSGVETGNKRITVLVRRHGRAMHTGVIIRTRAWDQATP